MIPYNKVYTEVNAVLNIMDKEYQNNIPMKLKKLISNNKSDLYNINYDLIRPLHEQNISKEALSIIALIHLNYWCKDENEKKELYRIFQENEAKIENEKKLQYSPNDIFKNKRTEDNDIHEVSKNSQIVVYKETIINKCINYIKKLFKRLH